MNPSPLRLIRGERPPNLRTLAQWLGSDAHRRWEELVRAIQQNYPDTFRQRWLWTGPREGWSLRFTRTQTFCSLVPERGRFLVAVVLSPEEQEQVEAAWEELGQQFRADYRAGALRAAGRRLLVEVRDDETLADVQRLLAMKRPPRLAHG